MESELEKLKTENNELKTKREADKRIHEKRCEILQKTIQENEQENKKDKEGLNIQLNKLKEEKEALWTELGNSNQAQCRQKERLDRIVQEFTELSANFGALNNAHTLLKNENDQIRSELGTLEYEIENNRASIAMLERHNKDVDHQVDLSKLREKDLKLKVACLFLQNFIVK